MHPRQAIKHLLRMGDPQAARQKITMECPFCKIIAGESPAQILHRDHQVTAFRDTHPIASTHILIVTNRHIESVNELDSEDDALVGHMVMVAKDLAKQEGIADPGYRPVSYTHLTLPTNREV